MGFMDKAKKMAEQAQAKLDEAQKQFNKGQQPGQQSGPAVEYDEHGRPLPQGQPQAPPHGDPLAAAAAAPPAEAPAPEPDPSMPAADAPPATVPAAEAPPADASPAEAPAPPARPEPGAPVEDRNHPSYAPPKLSSGDPLAG